MNTLSSVSMKDFDREGKRLADKVASSVHCLIKEWGGAEDSLDDTVPFFATTEAIKEACSHAFCQDAKECLEMCKRLNLSLSNIELEKVGFPNWTCGDEYATSQVQAELYGHILHWLNEKHFNHLKHQGGIQ